MKNNESGKARFDLAQAAERKTKFCLWDIGVRNGLPRYFIFFWFLLSSLLFLPESFLQIINFQGFVEFGATSKFVVFYIKNSSFPNAMTAFWGTCPMICAINTSLFVSHIKCEKYAPYLERRENRLKDDSNTALVVGVCFYIALYFWATLSGVSSPKIFGQLSPEKSRLMMLIIHAGNMGFVIPALIALLVTELRAFLSTNSDKKEV